MESGNEKKKDHREISYQVGWKKGKIQWNEGATDALRAHRGDHDDGATERKRLQLLWFPAMKLPQVMLLPFAVCTSSLLFWFNAYYLSMACVSTSLRKMKGGSRNEFIFSYYGCGGRSLCDRSRYLYRMDGTSALEAASRITESSQPSRDCCYVFLQMDNHRLFCRWFIYHRTFIIDCRVSGRMDEIIQKSRNFHWAYLLTGIIISAMGMLLLFIRLIVVLSFPLAGVPTTYFGGYARSSTRAKRH